MLQQFSFVVKRAVVWHLLLLSFPLWKQLLFDISCYMSFPLWKQLLFDISCYMSFPLWKQLLFDISCYCPFHCESSCCLTSLVIVLSTVKAAVVWHLLLYVLSTVKTAVVWHLLLYVLSTVKAAVVWHLLLYVLSTVKTAVVWHLLLYVLSTVKAAVVWHLLLFVFPLWKQLLFYSSCYLSFSCMLQQRIGAAYTYTPSPCQVSTAGVVGCYTRPNHTSTDCAVTWHDLFSMSPSARGYCNCHSDYSATVMCSRCLFLCCLV